MLRLDINLVFTIVNLLVLYLLMKKFLFKRVDAMLQKRNDAINAGFEEAKKLKAEAEDIKEQNLKLMEKTEQEKEGVMKEARDKALAEYDRIVKNADMEARKTVLMAEGTIAEEKEKALRDMQSQMRDLVIDATAKVVGKQASGVDSGAIYDDFLAQVAGTSAAPAGQES